MVANPARRTIVTDAALEILGRDGARAVTHRAVDAEAGLPPGTCANYYPTRARLLAGMSERIFDLLKPDPQRLKSLDKLPTAEAAPAYVAYVVERLLARPNLSRALIELRLEASRGTEVAEPMTRFLRSGFADDLAYHRDRDLPAGPQTVLLMHHLVNGVILDALTISLDPDQDPVERARTAAAALYAPALDA